MLIPIILIIVFTLLNGFFAGSEMAFINADNKKLENQAEAGDKKAKLARELNRNQARVLAVVQVAITLIGTLNSSFATSGLMEHLAPYLGQQGAAIAISLIVTLLTLIFGELLPKSIGQAIPEKFSRISARALNLVYTIFKPVVWFLTKALGFFQFILPIDFSGEDKKLTFSNIREIVVQGGEEGVLETEEVGMMQGVLKLNRKMAREIMIPRRHALMIDINNEKEFNHNLIINTHYSRLPVFENSEDEIIGIVFVKDYLRAAALADDFQEVDLRDLAHDSLNIPETLLLDDVFDKIQRTNNHIAIIRDEYGQMVGLVTLEDIIEEIVGEIYDEYDIDEEDTLYEEVDKNSWVVQGLMNINDFNELFGTVITSNEVDTIGGYFTMITQIIPNDDRIGTTLKTDSLILELTKVDKMNIAELKVTRVDED